MGPRGSADPTHEGRDGLPPVRDFSPRRRHRPHTMPGRVDRWGRAAARTLPKRVGTGCRPSVTSPRAGGIGSTPKRAAATGASVPRSVGSSAFRRLGRTPCRAAWTRDPGHDRLQLRRRCAMPHTSRATRPHGAQLRGTSVDASATSDHTRAGREEISWSGVGGGACGSRSCDAARCHLLCGTDGSEKQEGFGRPPVFLLSCFPDSLFGPCFHQSQRDSGLAASSAISDRARAGWRSVDAPVIVFPMRDRVGAVERWRCDTGSRGKSKILGATVWRMEPPGHPSIGDETVV